MFLVSALGGKAFAVSSAHLQTISCRTFLTGNIEN